MNEEYYVEPCEFTCAKKFLDALDETNEKWRGETWLYRGQNVDKLLLPSAMRPCKSIDEYVHRNVFRHGDSPYADPTFTAARIGMFKSNLRSIQENQQHAELVERILQESEQRLPGEQLETQLGDLTYQRFAGNYFHNAVHSMAERTLVAAFIGLADQVGLKVPQDSLDKLLNQPFLFGDRISAALASGQEVEVLQPEEYTGIAYALARHHRVPTRLLDFTYRPLVAAFFAAHSDEKLDDDSNRRIVVWAVCQNSLRQTDLQLVKHRRGEIGFLQAQDGAFVHDRLANEKFWFVGEWLPFEVLCEIS